MLGDDNNNKKLYGYGLLNQTLLNLIKIKEAI